MIFAIAAVSLNLILGYGGMVSFGHAAYLGIGAYAVGILGFYGIHNGWLQLRGRDRRVGAGRARDRRGVDPHQRHLLHHDHARLHPDALLPRHLARGVRRRRRHAARRRAASSPAIDLRDPVPFYYLVLARCSPAASTSSTGSSTPASAWCCAPAKSNEARTRAIGFSPYPYRLAAFVIAGAMCGARRRAATPTTPPTSRPSFMSWTQSGEIMFMVILGGIATLVGPVLGAFALLLLEDLLAALDAALADDPRPAARAVGDLLPARPRRPASGRRPG